MPVVSVHVNPSAFPRRRGPRKMHPQVIALCCASTWADRLGLEGEERINYIQRHEDRVIGIVNKRSKRKRSKGSK